MFHTAPARSPRWYREAIANTDATHGATRQRIITGLAVTSLGPIAALMTMTPAALVAAVIVVLAVVGYAAWVAALPRARTGFALELLRLQSEAAALARTAGPEIAESARALQDRLDGVRAAEASTAHAELAVQREHPRAFRTLHCDGEPGGVQTPRAIGTFPLHALPEPDASGDTPVETLAAAARLRPLYAEYEKNTNDLAAAATYTRNLVSRYAATLSRAPMSPVA